MKVVGEFVKPKGMTNHSKRPSFDLNVVFHTLGVVVTKLHINITKVFPPLELIKEIVDSRNHVLVLDCDFI
jgi:hypothetical protein